MGIGYYADASDLGFSLRLVMKGMNIPRHMFSYRSPSGTAVRNQFFLTDKIFYVPMKKVKGMYHFF